MSDRNLWKSGSAYSWTMLMFNGNTPVTGLVNGNFTKTLALNDANSAVTVTVTEIDSVNEAGWYKVTYTPNATGHWVCTASHATYSPQGWKDEIQAYTRDTDDLAYPATTGRSLAVNASSQVGIDWANVGAPTTTNNLSGTTVSAVTNAVGSVTGSVGSVAGAVGSVTGNVGGNVTGSVGSLASQAKTDAENAVWNGVRSSHTTSGSFGEGAASVQGNVTGSVGSVSGAVGSVTGAVGSVTGNVGGDISGNVIKKVLGGGATAFTSIGVQADVEQWRTATPNALSSGQVDAVASSATLTAGSIQAIWDALTSALTTTGSIGKRLADDINATISSRATPAQILTTPANLITTDASGYVTVTSVAASAINAIADGLLDRTSAIDTYTLRQELKLIGAILLGKASGGPTNSVFRSMDDSANRVTAVTTSAGDRTSVTLNTT